MGASVQRRPKARTQLVTGTLVDPDPSTVSRLLGELGDAHENLAAQVKTRDVVIATLAVGANIINHGLGRKAQGCTVTPTVPNVTWAWAMTAADDKQVTITTVGIVQPNATIEVH